MSDILIIGLFVCVAAMVIVAVVFVGLRGETMSEQPQPPGTWDWSCGHTAPAMCAECYRELAQRATELAAALDKALAGPEAPIDADRWRATMAEIDRLRAQIGVLADENNHFRQIIDGYSRCGYTVMRAQLAEAAAFLDRLYNYIAAERTSDRPKEAMLELCRAMAKKLRRET